MIAIKYKCRLCGKVYTHKILNLSNRKTENLIDKKWKSSRHRCNDTTIGITDFVGFTIEDI